MRTISDSTVNDRTGRIHLLKDVVSRGPNWMVMAVQDANKLARILEAPDQRTKGEWHRRLSCLEGQATRLPLIGPEAILELPGSEVGYTFRPIFDALAFSDFLPPSDRTQSFDLKRRLQIAGAISRSFKQVQQSGFSFCDFSPTDLLIKEESDRPTAWFTAPERLSRAGTAVCTEQDSAFYRAPEINRGSHQPDVLSDNYLLAVVLFELLRLGHPFLGSRHEDLTLEELELAKRGELPDIDHLSRAE